MWQNVVGLSKPNAVHAIVFTDVTFFQRVTFVWLICRCFFYFITWHSKSKPIQPITCQFQKRTSALPTKLQLLNNDKSNDIVLLPNYRCSRDGCDRLVNSNYSIVTDVVYASLSGIAFAGFIFWFETNKSRNEIKNGKKHLLRNYFKGLFGRPTSVSENSVPSRVIRWCRKYDLGTSQSIFPPSL